jgi:SAM-dependent methyltransferase
VNIKKNFLRPLAHAIYNRGPFGGLMSYLQVIREFSAYRKSASPHENISVNNFDPWPIDRYYAAGEAGMYFYQDTWCAAHLKKIAPPQHMDIGSSMMFLAMALQLSEVTYVDIRPFAISFPNFRFMHGDLMNLPIESSSIESLSSLSVIEHVGLSRYGDELDPHGTDKACSELARILKPGGRLYLAVPTQAKSETHFNAGRYFNPDDFISKVKSLTLVDEKYGLDERMVCRREYDHLGKPYAYGCFAFIKATE